jgi:Carboxypeptidase regulatory-like domain
MRWLLALVLSGVLLSGCSAAPPVADPAASLEDAEAAAESLDIEATETTGVIRGIVVDDTLKPLAGALVALSGGANTTTSAEGAFGFEELEPGTYFMVAALPGYTTVQQSVEVVVGVDVPEAVRILLSKLASATPFLETLSAKIHLTGAVWATVPGQFSGGVSVGNLIGEGNYVFGVEITPGGTVAQTELVWTATQPLGEIGAGCGGTYDHGDAVQTACFEGRSPIVARANATGDNLSADSLSYSFWARPFDPVPVGAQVDQAIDAYISVFHNFLPNEGWTFTNDGPHPVPA